MDLLLGAMLGVLVSLGAVGVIGLFLFMNPDKVEQWAALILRVAAKLPGGYRHARRLYVQYDFQSRVNRFTHEVADDAPYLATHRVRIEWIDPKKNKQAFLEDDRVVIRLGPTDPDDRNFVRAAYLFVSTSLLHTCKRYISKTQKESIDLFVTAKLLELQKAHVVNHFLEEYLHPRTVDEDSKITELFDCYGRLRQSGLFYEVFLQELQFLGGKVFGGRRHANVQEEVNELVRFLDRLATRNVGETDRDLDFVGTYCRFTVVIVGRPFNITPGGEIWTRFIARYVTPQEIETVYLLSPLEHRSVVDAIGEAVADTYEIFRTRSANVRLFLRGSPMDIKLNT